MLPYSSISSLFGACRMKGIHVGFGVTFFFSMRGFGVTLGDGNWQQPYYCINLREGKGYPSLLTYFLPDLKCNVVGACVLGTESQKYRTYFSLDKLN